MPKITREPLTRRSVDSAKATGKAYRMRDATVPGLVLRVSATGARCWAIVWGRGQERTFGDYPALPLEAARERAKKLAGEIAAHGAPLAVIEAARPKPATLGSFVREHYGPWAKANQKAGQATVDAIAAHFAEIVDKPLTAICAFDLERFKAQRLKAGIKPSTVNRDLSRIRGALSRAVDWGMIEQHPMRTVKQAKGADDSRVRYLTQEEERQLRAGLQKREQERRALRTNGNRWHADRGHVVREMWPADGFTDHLLPIVLVALNTGMRRGELLGLDWADVNLPGKLVTVTVANAKSRKARHIPLNTEAHDTLARWRQQGAGTGLVFPSPRTGRRMDNISSSWEELCDTIALPGFRFHDLRHTFASRLVMAGVDLNTVRELLGHSDIRMTLRYAHLAPDKLAEAVSKLSG
ncbi:MULTISPECIES: site-specific integrase [Xanthomonas]|uniref:Site-specific recombinase, phage integrase family n=2 Tax=Xanthomonas TaxID=338 RepID=A0A7Z7IXN9_XANCH|nr:MULTISPECIES: site-specific integrase [Xanthomonas]ATS39460.2 site-specific integrase [Xanthomonas citri pv. phaseoli var. fuscans]ATS41734.2 site-specific integrase [Xanthomonas citri pv. phaseoli var. fuscans]ATS47463.2 site-specific integrase [Xanthomonas citri pv. phaseoli var. fuscans]ATS86159.2 site-specific integrase [Xanthomonas citri pv. phaseoli var. fuscans]UZA98203.1 site-specific integrase [Xanthomonas citri pv. fuscans]